MSKHSNINLNSFSVMKFKEFIPDFNGIGKTEWGKPNLSKRNYVLLALAVVMLVVVFIPWVRYSIINPEKSTEILSGSRLGITTWYGIVGLVGALITAYGVLYKKYAFAFWGAIISAIMGYIGINSYADIKFDDYIVFKETMENFDRNSVGAPVSHIGANIFLLASSLVAAFSFIKIACKEATDETTPISKAAFGLAAVVALVLCLDSILFTKCLSGLALNIITWNLPLAAILLTVYSFYTDKKEGICRSQNAKTVALLVVAFFFTNPVFTTTKNIIKEGNKCKTATEFHSIDVRSYDDKEASKAIEKKMTEAMEDKLTPIS